LAVLGPFIDARERVQHVRPAKEREAEEELPVAQAHDDELVRGAGRGQVNEDGKLAAREPVGSRATGDRGDAAREGTGEGDYRKVARAATLWRELQPEVAGRERDAAGGRP